MTQAKTLLVTASILSLFVPPVSATPGNGAPIVLAQADTNDAVAAAQAAVEAARADLRSALAAGQGVDEARQKLRDALQALDQARVAAGMPPANPAELEPVLPEESAAPAKQPPAEQPPPPADQTQPPPDQQPPAANPPADQTGQPPAEQQTQPPADQNKPPKGKGKPKLPPGAHQQQPADQTPPAQPPATDQTPPPPDQQQNQPPPADQPATPPPNQPQQPPPPADQQTQQQQQQQPPAPEPQIELPKPVVVEPPPPPPPAATQGEFNLQKFKNRPKFGAIPPAEAAKEPPPSALPKSEDALQNGAVVQAPDGRVIVKEGGQVTVKHDDAGRFVQQGDKIQTGPSDNGTETTTVSRPDGTQIVTIRDKSGNIIQRYRKNRNGSVDVLIGDVEQPGMIGRIFGKGAQPAPPRPPRHPPVLNLQLGPVQLNIPQQDYIVESSRADEQQLQSTLMAPPVERVERTYSLEEIRQNARLRDKVRRIDFDTVTFDTGQATVPDDQIAKLETIGDAIRQIVTRDPTQVFLIEGHTDAIGSDLANLALSDRRAETVAELLSYYYAIPPENLVTQGYGEQFLKVPTTAANRENRRVAFRNITYLMRGTAQAQ